MCWLVFNYSVKAYLYVHYNNYLDVQYNIAKLFLPEN